jgi:Mlc titration factor MtfA (ptsG expression regulator)
MNLAIFCIRYSGSRSLVLYELTLFEGIIAILVLWGLFEFTRFIIEQMRFSPFIQELRRQQPHYYTQLPYAQQKQFENRLSRFLTQKQFISRGENFEVTLPMQVHIASCAVQLTFGLGPVYFSHFKTILVYPDRYYSTINKTYHCGEVNPRGIIVLSWKDFESGYRNQTDGFNLGLHEMAHALHLENVIRNYEYDFLDRQHLQAWHQEATKEMAAQQLVPSVFLRDQACQNVHEFFAVCVESFFERSQEFNNAHPNLYQALSRLLQQDPARNVFQL